MILWIHRKRVSKCMSQEVMEGGAAFKMKGRGVKEWREGGFLGPLLMKLIRKASTGVVFVWTVFTGGLGKTGSRGLTGREPAMSLNKTRHWFMSVSRPQSYAHKHTCTDTITVLLNHWAHSHTVDFSKSTLLLSKKHCSFRFFLIFNSFFTI